jgi:hypothetical protein
VRGGRGQAVGVGGRGQVVTRVAVASSPAHPQHTSNRTVLPVGHGRGAAPRGRGGVMSPQGDGRTVVSRQVLHSGGESPLKVRLCSSLHLCWSLF